MNVETFTNPFIFWLPVKTYCKNLVIFKISKSDKLWPF